MKKQKLTTALATASGQMVSQPCVVKLFNILGGADAATAKFYDGISAAGTLRFGLGVAAATSDSEALEEGIRFENGVYVTITGTTPSVIVGIEAPKS